MFEDKREQPAAQLGALAQIVSARGPRLGWKSRKAPSVPPSRLPTLPLPLVPRNAFGTADLTATVKRVHQRCLADLSGSIWLNALLFVPVGDHTGGTVSGVPRQPWRGLIPSVNSWVIMPSLAGVLREHVNYTAWANTRLIEAASALSHQELVRDFATADHNVLGTLGVVRK
jgi:hypothetical protein